MAAVRPLSVERTRSLQVYLNDLHTIEGRVRRRDEAGWRMEVFVFCDAISEGEMKVLLANPGFRNTLWDQH